MICARSGPGETAGNIARVGPGKAAVPGPGAFYPLSAALAAATADAA